MTTTAGTGRWTRRLLGGLGVLLIATLAAASTNAGGVSMWDGHVWGMGGGLGWGLMWIVGLLWMVALVAIPVALIYWLVDGDRTASEGDGALAHLRDRYARGEIDDEEFETRRAKLEER
ncbi:SHOCT domain-containing protein [Halalkalicoccus sp. NIPERK01]|uniref:SHOCT domain-containing protein n=1 Tax=Halalkalicoccus sp. NIPERK01 TaxID=3053469 RepID=UPI00256F099D|nr:SHOCT domain-containing protein [Halalkalicoccus sp. NIPERK01]MDL5362311.1 SHOCT domain-containing protein [Halalkalicoccus sp. NIPERK01]